MSDCKIEGTFYPCHFPHFDFKEKESKLRTQNLQSFQGKDQIKNLITPFKMLREYRIRNPWAAVYVDTIENVDDVRAYRQCAEDEYGSFVMKGTFWPEWRHLQYENGTQYKLCVKGEEWKGKVYTSLLKEFIQEVPWMSKVVGVGYVERERKTVIQVWATDLTKEEKDMLTRKLNADHNEKDKAWCVKDQTENFHVQHSEYRTFTDAHLPHTIGLAKSVCNATGFFTKTNLEALQRELKALERTLMIQAAESTFEEVNRNKSEFNIDLHQQLPEAVDYLLDKHIARKQKKVNQLGKSRIIRVIPGRGSHSEEKNQSRVRDETRKYLQEKGYEVRVARDKGSFTIKLEVLSRL